MKKVLFVSLIFLGLTGCKKVKNECNCGTVISKTLLYGSSGISHSITFYDPCTDSDIGVFVTEELYNTLEVNDVHCVE